MMRILAFLSYSILQLKNIQGRCWAFVCFELHNVHAELAGHVHGINYITEAEQMFGLLTLTSFIPVVVFLIKGTL